MNSLLTLNKITKSFNGSVVLSEVDLTVEQGEVRALLGENGAGKSTLIKILAGVHQADSGYVVINNVEREMRNPRESALSGIATVHQEIMITPGLSVAENILLGSKIPSKFGKVHWKKINEIALKYFSDLGQSLDVNKPVEELSAVQMTMTAIARALCLDAKVLILDEPTAALTDAEVRQIFTVMRKLRDRGLGIIYVSHRLEEVFNIADTYTVLRNGVKVGEGSVNKTSIPQLVNLMAGREISSVFQDRQLVKGKVFLSVTNLSARKIKEINFDLGVGEIFGIGGLAGSGRSEILRVIAGAQRRHSGEINLDGKKYTPRNITAAHHQHVVLIPQERRRDGLIPGSILSNLVISILSRLSISGVLVNSQNEQRFGKASWEKFSIRGKALSQEIFTLSGGNQQKVVLAKFLALGPKLLLIDEPTKGVDVATRSEIYRILAQLASSGVSIIVVSSELSELLAISNRILIMHEGRQVTICESSETTESEALLAYYGGEK